MRVFELSRQPLDEILTTDQREGVKGLLEAETASLSGGRHSNERNGLYKGMELTETRQISVTNLVSPATTQEASDEDFDSHNQL